jgi:GNAT superfamily N-acetyltransferase
MRFVEFAPSPERDDSDEMPNQLLVLANRWWNATDRQPQIEHVLNSLGWSIQQVESEDDAVQLQHRDGTTYFINADDFDPDLFEISNELHRNIGIIEEARLPAEVEEFLDSLSPDDAGVDEVGPYRIHYEGFTDDCQSSEDYCDNPERVYQQVFADHIAREGGRKPIKQSFTGDEEYPILYSIFKIPRQVKEIARLPKSEVGDWGDKGTLADPEHPIKTKPLPGGSKFSYAVNRTGTGDIEIMIFDGRTLAAEMDLFDTLDFMKTWRVETVVVDPDYRGQGLGKALYGIALSILKLTVEAGETQTQHGQQMWLMLNSIPGVEVLGYNMEPTNKYKPQRSDTVVDQNERWTRYTFPVAPGTRSMRSGRKGTGIYTSNASMIAKWTGR